MNLLQILWPSLERDEVGAAQNAQAVAESRHRLREATFEEAAVAITEAQRIFDAESERRRSADNKATIYLAAVAAVVPLMASSETIVWDNKIGMAPSWLSVALLLAALAYLAAAGYCAASTLRVRSQMRVDAEDILDAPADLPLSTHLARLHLSAALANRASTNAKMDDLKLAHEFMLRAACAFAMLLSLEAGWNAVSELLKSAFS